MDPSTPLDHAAFQLTPTRTRCDLLVCSGKGVYEKIASGLLEPFLTHLQCARDQIPKGGYSLALRPPPATGRSPTPSGGGRGDDAAASPPTSAPPSPSWFTKGTLERFVRFVRTPEILERVAAIEKEIVHIESCVQPAAPEDGPAATTTAVHDGIASGTGKAEHQGSASSLITGDDNSRNLNSPSKKVEANGHDATHGENSKLCLQQMLETRKAVLMKEQGMAYARAAVAGYEVANIDDLVSFADAFGASRLSEACMNFKDICEKKEKDKIWMDELAAIGTRSCSELQVVNSDHPELNGTFNDAVTDPTVAAAAQGNNGQTPDRESWIPATASNGIYHEKCQTPIGWSNYPPQYMYNLQNPAQQMPLCQGYAFSGTLPPYPPGQFDNAQPPPLAGDAYAYQRYYMSSSPNHSKPIKGKAARSTSSGSRSGERSHGSSKSGSESDGQIRNDASEEEILGKSWGHKRSSKKSSKTVVIRNLNYISSERRDAEDGSTSESSVEGDINEDFLKQKVENIVGSLKKHHKTSHHQQNKKGKNKNHRNIQNDDNSFDQNAEIDAKANACHTKGDESWHKFQSILMRDESSSTEVHGKNNIIPNDSNEKYHLCSGDDICVIKNTHFATSYVHNLPLETESSRGNRQRLAATDLTAVKDNDDNCKSNSCSHIFYCDENYSVRMKGSHNADEELLFSEHSEFVTPHNITAYANGPLTPNPRRDADCLVISKSTSLLDGERMAEYSMFEGDQNLKSLDEFSNEKIRTELPTDDSFIIATRSTADEHSSSHWETDMSIISGLAFSTEVECVGVASHSTGNSRVLDNHEPDDLQMVLERNMGSEHMGASWTPDIDYTADVTLNVVKKSHFVHQSEGSSEPPNPKGAFGEGNPRIKLPAKDAKSKSIHGSLTKAKPETMSRTKKASIMSREEIQRNKTMKEQENRKRMEDLLAERQKRIAKRSSSTTSPAMTKGSGGENRYGTSSSKHEKKIARPVQGNSRLSLLHRMEVTSSVKNSYAPG